MMRRCRDAIRKKPRTAKPFMKIARTSSITAQATTDRWLRRRAQTCIRAATKAMVPKEATEAMVPLEATEAMVPISMEATEAMVPISMEATEVRIAMTVQKLRSATNATK